jgi:hypothetical protein
MSCPRGRHLLNLANFLTVRTIRRLNSNWPHRLRAISAESRFPDEGLDGQAARPADEGTLETWER